MVWRPPWPPSSLGPCWPGRDRVSRISVTIITFNEATNIRECLESVAWADEIVVVDAESRDETVAIAREYTDQVFVNPWSGFTDRKSTRLNSSHIQKSRMPSSA